MYNYVVRRVGSMAATLFFITLITLTVTNTLPGDVVLLILDPSATEQSFEAFQTQLGLNRSLYVQYIDWVVEPPQGNIGGSFRLGRPVARFVAKRLPRLIVLVVAAMLAAIVLSMPLGVYAAANQNETPDVSVSMFAFVGISMPIFLQGLVPILVFAVWLSPFPTGGYVSPSNDPVGSLTRLALPAGAMGFAFIAYIMRMTRSSTLEMLSEKYTNLVRVKGMSQRVIVLKHMLKNVVIPVITITMFQSNYAFGGVVVLEEVLFRSGIGRLTLTAIQSRDISLIQGCILVVALIYMFPSFAADLLYAYFDPRVRYGGSN